MSWKRKPRVLYALQGVERQQIEDMSKQIEMLNASHVGILNMIMKRESVPIEEDVAFDSKQLAFVRVQKAQ